MGAIDPVLAELSACLCAELGETVPCFCGVIVGNDIPLEYAGECEEECGAAYVRLVNAFPSINFPQQDTASGCTSLMAYTISVGVVRCAPVGDDRGNPPTPEEVQKLTDQLLSDMHAIRRAVRCCLADKFEDVEYLLGQYVPLPSQGGVAGGEMTLTIQEPY